MIAADGDEDHEWTAGPTSTGLTDDNVTPAANNLVRFGHIAICTAESDWYEVHFVTDEYNGVGRTNYTNPDDLNGRNYPVDWMYVADEVSIRCQDGPTIRGDEWTIDTEYDYPVERIFPEVSGCPDVRWRSTGNGVEQIAVALDATLLGTVESMPGNDLLGVALRGINFPAATLEGWDVGGAAWSTIATLSANNGMTGLHWTRRGNTVIATGTAGTYNPYLYHNEFKNGYFKFDTAGKIRKIVAHSEGRLGGTEICKGTTLILEDCDGTEGASGTSGQIWAPAVCAVCKLDSERYAGYRLAIPATTTAEGYYTIGSWVIGPTVYHGQDYSWGRAIETQPNVELLTALDGTRRAKRYGAERRVVEYGWADGVDLTDVYEDDIPDYLEASTGGSALAVASWADVPLVYEGAIRWLDGPSALCIYHPRIVKADSPDLRVSRHDFVVGRITSPIRIENVQGDESSTEVVRTATIVLEEEV